MYHIKKCILCWVYLISTTFFLLGCEQESTSPPRFPAVALHPPNELTRAIYSTQWQLDPHFVNNVADAAPLRDLLVGLMQFDPQGKVIPAIGKAFVSQDGKNWSIELDEQAKWSNGQPVTAQDFVASWRRLADPQHQAPLSPYLSYMGLKNAKAILAGQLPPEHLGVTAASPLTLQIELEQPHYQLPQMLAHIALLPTYQGVSPTLSQLFVSNGTYQLQAQTADSLLLKATSEYQAFQAVRYTLISAVQNPDRFDLIENPLDNYQRDLVYLPRLCSYFYEFNVSDPILSQKPIRQAIRAMIPPSEVGRELGISNHSLLPRALLPHTPPSNTLSAEQLLNPLDQALSPPLKLVLSYDHQGKHPTIAQRIARTLGQSDLFQVQLQAVDWQQLLAKRQQRQFQLIRSGWCADYPDPVVFLLPFHSASPDNKTGYANPVVDQQLGRLQQTADAIEREKLIFDIVQQLENDVVILPLFQYQRRLSIAPDIQGVERNNSSEVIYSKDLYRQ